MSALQQPVRQAQHRLWLQRGLATLGWTLAAAAGLFACAVVGQRCWHWAEDSGWFYLVSLSGLAVAAVLAAVIWTWVTREGVVVAAVRLDEAAGLKERLSSGLYCDAQQDPFARAVVADAERAGEGLVVRQHLPLAVPRSANWAGAGAVLALLVLLVFPTLDLGGQIAEKKQEEERREMVQRAEVQVRPVVDRTYERLKEKNPDLKDELEALQNLDTALARSPLDVQRQAMRSIEQLSDKLRQKQDNPDLVGATEFRRMMRRLEMQGGGESQVHKLAQSLARGDFKAAQDAMAAINAQLAKLPEDAQAKERSEELRKQLAELSAKIDQLARDNQRIKDQLTATGMTEEQLKKALENLSKEDFEAVAKQLAEKGLSREQVDKVMQNVKRRCSACNSAGKLASSLSTAAGQATQGQQGAEAAGAALSAAGEQLSQMEALEQEMQSLRASLADLDAAKDELGNGCSACQGTGQVGGKPCSKCQGTGMGSGQGSGMGQNMGQGEGGVAPQQQTDFQLVQRKTPVHTTPGSINSQRFVSGEQYKGEVSQEFVEAAISAQRDATDAVTREQVPRMYHSSVRNYFTRTGGDLPANAADTVAEPGSGDSPTKAEER